MSAVNPDPLIRRAALIGLITKTGPIATGDLLGVLGGPPPEIVLSDLYALQKDGHINSGLTQYTWASGRTCTHRAHGPIVWHLGPIPIVQGECPTK